MGLRSTVERLSTLWRGNLKVLSFAPRLWSAQPVTLASDCRPMTVLDQPTSTRKLAAILSADIAGYSALMSADEEGTVRKLKGVQEAVLPLIERFGGRIIDLAGDGILAEFQSAVRAVESAAAVQACVKGLNADTGPPMLFRIGVNVGDVIHEGDRLYGDGINVAARLQAIAEPGGICISNKVHEEVRDRVKLAFTDMGDQELKNIARPVRVFAFDGNDSPAGRLPRQNIREPPLGPRGRRWNPKVILLTVGSAALLAVSFLAASKQSQWSWSGSKLPGQTASIQGIGEVPRLSLVALPFTNLSGDPEQEYFADGITDDLTTDLSHLAGSFVIARNTAFSYKGKSVDVKQVGRDLGVRYVLDGSVRRIGERVLLNAQLVSTDTGGQIWADRLEGDRSRLGELQAEFVGRLASSLNVQLTQAESLRSLRERPNNPDAADFAMRGWAALNRPRNPTHLREALKLFDDALDRDAHLTSALVGKARSLTYLAWLRFSATPEEDLAAADKAIAHVLANFPEHPMARFVRGDIAKAQHKFDFAISEFEAAIESDRNLALAYEALGHAKTLIGRSNEAIAPIQKALRLSPHDPALNLWLFHMCHAFTHLARYSEAIPWCLKSVAAGPLWLAYVDLAADYAWIGQATEAKSAVAELLKLMPSYTVKKWATAGFSDNPEFLVEYQRVVEGLRKAGLPDG
jgi:adenylate cyclase